MKRLSKLRFDALAGYSRSPYLPLSAQELEWFEDGNEKVLGVVSLDLSDQDFLYTILGRDKHGRFRAVHVGINIPTREAARVQLEIALAESATLPPEAFYQYDERGTPLDFFTPIIAESKQHRSFRQLITTSQDLPARGLLAELMHYFADIDGNFVQEFQSTGFDSRLWELYLYALFTELGYALDRSHAAPDFHCVGLGEFFVEATTINPSATGPRIDDTEAYFSDYVPMKFGSALFSKLQKRYWELAHVKSHPLVFAVQDFHAPQSMTWSSAALPEYLYGIRQTERRKEDGTSEVVSVPVAKYVWEGKEIPAGFFFQRETEHISAVLANPSGTLTKFTRMGYLAGFGKRKITMIRRGICYRNKVIPEAFVAEVTGPGYSETWVEGVSVYHNPRAVHPLPEIAIPGAAHHVLRGGRIRSSLPPYFPVGSVTAIIPQRTC